MRIDREIPLDAFYVDYFETALQPDEILTEVLVPKEPTLHQLRLSPTVYLPESECSADRLRARVPYRSDSPRDGHRPDRVRVLNGSTSPRVSEDGGPGSPPRIREVLDLAARAIGMARARPVDVGPNAGLAPAIVDVIGPHPLNIPLDSAEVRRLAAINSINGA